MNAITRPHQHELEQANAANLSHVRRRLYRSLPDDERRQLLEAAEGADIVHELIDGRFALDCWREAEAERRFWHAMTWTLVIGGGLGWLLTLVIFGRLAAGG